jgi:hypothetical protein
MSLRIEREGEHSHAVDDQRAERAHRANPAGPNYDRAAG